MRKIVFFITLMIFCISAHAQYQITSNVIKADSIIPDKSTDISLFSPLIGSWKGKGMGGYCDEVWLAPIKGRMHGMFRLEREEEIYFTEFMTLYHDSIGHVLKIKHFSADFIGWESNDKSLEFRFLKAEKDKLFFSGITFHFPDPETLHIYLAFRQKDKSYREEEFIMKRFAIH